MVQNNKKALGLGVRPINMVSPMFSEHSETSTCIHNKREIIQYAFRTIITVVLYIQSINLCKMFTSGCVFLLITSSGM